MQGLQRSGAVAVEPDDACTSSASTCTAAINCEPDAVGSSIDIGG